ncbi:hypothetical protein [Bordetella sp. N]|uniref:hypothetical protein n=1 Tax=Bordetella sp. N TaxID=1746199 RepID=UPI00070DD676|nr:hypothetical protein [Bordetella sp. N]ALM84792.1 hypothetical protein ASB57_19060 [Bordetella sp. N]
MGNSTLSPAEDSMQGVVFVRFADGYPTTIDVVASTSFPVFHSVASVSLDATVTKVGPYNGPTLYSVVSPTLGITPGSVQRTAVNGDVSCEGLRAGASVSGRDYDQTNLVAHAPAVSGPPFNPAYSAQYAEYSVRQWRSNTANVTIPAQYSSGDGQSAAPNTQFPHVLVVGVTDSASNPVNYTGVTFQITTGDATFVRDSNKVFFSDTLVLADTEDSNLAGIYVKAGPNAGTVIVKASSAVGRQDVFFHLQISGSTQPVTPGTPMTLTPFGDGQSAIEGADFGRPLAVTASNIPSGSGTIKIVFSLTGPGVFDYARPSADPTLQVTDQQCTVTLDKSSQSATAPYVKAGNSKGTVTAVASATVQSNTAKWNNLAVLAPVVPITSMTLTPSNDGQTALENTDFTLPLSVDAANVPADADVITITFTLNGPAVFDYTKVFFPGVKKVSDTECSVVLDKSRLLAETPCLKAGSSAATVTATATASVASNTAHWNNLTVMAPTVPVTIAAELVMTNPTDIYVPAGSTQQVIWKLQTIAGKDAVPGKNVTLALEMSDGTVASFSATSAQTTYSQKTDPNGMISTPLFIGKVPGGIMITATEDGGDAKPDTEVLYALPLTE